MEAKILSYEIKFYPGMNPGVKDRRFKSGYRVMPHPVVNLGLNLLIEDPESYLRKQDVLVDTSFNVYVVTNIDHFVSRHRAVMLTANKISSDVSSLSLPTTQQFVYLKIRSVSKETSSNPIKTP